MVRQTGRHAPGSHLVVTGCSSPDTGSVPDVTGSRCPRITRKADLRSIAHLLRSIIAQIGGKQGWRHGKLDVANGVPYHDIARYVAVCALGGELGPCLATDRSGGRNDQDRSRDG